MTDGVARHATDIQPILAQPSPRWSRRQLGWAVGASTLLALVVVVRGTSGIGLDPMWLGLGGVSAVFTGIALSTYVPQRGQGVRLHLGCGRCAVAGLVLMSVAAWFVVAGSADGGNAAMSAVLAGIAAVQRLSQPSACPA